MSSMMMEFPNLRKCFIPDPGYVLFDIDQEGADARVVAWEANDVALMDAFDSGINVHTMNAKDAFPELTAIELEKHNGNLKSSYLYDRIKRAVHLTNYGGTAGTLAEKCSFSLGEAEDFQALWLYQLHPNILDWHERTEYDLQTKGRTVNAFGDVIDWFDRYSTELWRQALAWLPQSTVAAVAQEAQIICGRKLEHTQFLLQVHDSLLFQVQKRHVSAELRRMKEILDNIIVPYPRPMVMPWGIKYSEKSWGDCTKGGWEDFF